MGELNEAYGKGKTFDINGGKYEICPCPNKDMEDAMDRYSKLITSKFALNYMKLMDEKADKRKERIDAINWLLDKAFRDKVDKEFIGSIDRKTVEEIINFFLVD